MRKKRSNLHSTLKIAQKEVQRFVKPGESLIADLFKLRKEDFKNELSKLYLN